MRSKLIKITEDWKDNIEDRDLKRRNGSGLH